MVIAFIVIGVFAAVIAAMSRLFEWATAAYAATWLLGMVASIGLLVFAVGGSNHPLVVILRFLAWIVGTVLLVYVITQSLPLFYGSCDATTSPHCIP